MERSKLLSSAFGNYFIHNFSDNFTTVLFSLFTSRKSVSFILRAFSAVSDIYKPQIDMEKEIHALIGQLKTSDTDHPNIEKYIKFCTDNTSKILFATRKIAKLARQHGIVKSYNKKDNGEPIRKLSLKKTHLKAETLGLVRANLEYLIRSLTLASLIRDTGGDTIIIEEAFLTIFETERTV